jgi:hypothetical protein
MVSEWFGGREIAWARGDLLQPGTEG